MTKNEPPDQQLIQATAPPAPASAQLLAKSAAASPGLSQRTSVCMQRPGCTVRLCHVHQCVFQGEAKPLMNLFKVTTKSTDLGEGHG